MTSNTMKLTARLWGKSLIPEDISKLLDQEPSSTFNVGDYKVGPGGQKSKPKEDAMWAVSIDFTDSLEAAIHQIINIFNNQNVHSLPGVDVAILDVFWGLSETDCTFEGCLPIKALEGLRNLGFDLRFTIDK